MASKSSETSSKGTFIYNEEKKAVYMFEMGVKTRLKMFDINKAFIKHNPGSLPSYRLLKANSNIASINIFVN